MRATSTGQPDLDAELDRQWLSGDPTALAAIHRRYRARLEAVSFRVLRDRAEAEDVVQKVFLSLGRSAYRGDASLWTYLYRAAVNGSVNALRARRRREAAEWRLFEQQHVATQHAERSGPESTVLEGEILSALAQALLGVRPRHRRILTLRIVHGLTNSEIAEREQLPPATVGTWLRRGREELRRGLRPLLDEMEGGQR